MGVERGVVTEWMRRKVFLARWGAVARRWPIDRLLATTDLDLTPAEREELSYGIHSWRQLVAYYLARFAAPGSDGPFYCFGVAHGSTVDGLVRGLRHRGMAVPHLHLFDSFEGLPAEEDGVAVPPVWGVGAFAAPEQTLRQALADLAVPEGGYTIHKGWFSQTLKPELVESGAFRPAAYVDIDADLYSSTLEVLDFLFSHRLIRTGTLIGFDDWGDSDLWTAGESRAYKEAIARHGVRCAQLLSWGDQPLIRKLFLVVEAP